MIWTVNQEHGTDYVLRDQSDKERARHIDLTLLLLINRKFFTKGDSLIYQGKEHVYTGN